MANRPVDQEALRRMLRARIAEAGSASALARRWGLTRAHVSQASRDGKVIPIGVVRRLGFEREVRYRAVES